MKKEKKDNCDAEEKNTVESAAGAEKESAEKPQEPTAEEKLAEISAKYLYLQAEYQNYRKRVAKDIADTRITTLESTVTPFLTVYDFLEMAKTAAAKSDNIESLRQGLDMIIAQFFKAFEDLNIKAFDATGEVFDPMRHDAVGKENSETVAEGVVIKAWNNGFTLGEKLLRPARVIVSAGAPEKEPETPAEASPETENTADTATEDK